MCRPSGLSKYSPLSSLPLSSLYFHPGHLLTRSRRGSHQSSRHHSGKQSSTRTPGRGDKPAAVSRREARARLTPAEREARNQARNQARRETRAEDVAERRLPRGCKAQALLTLPQERDPFRSVRNYDVPQPLEEYILTKAGSVLEHDIGTHTRVYTYICTYTYINTYMHTYKLT